MVNSADKIYSAASLPQQDGVLVLDKPGGPSSAACIAIIKRKLGQKKIGHAGTLDPMATGVLLVLLGQATKISDHLLKSGEKIYSGTLQFGLTTDTWDAEGSIITRTDPASVSQADLEQALAEWVGTNEQIVPPYSAAKHQGRPLHKLARKGLATPVKVKNIKISRAELEWFRPPLARFRVACSSGTYIRSLAHSLGVRFGCGATLMELTREYSHPFGLDKAARLDKLIASPELLPLKVQSIPDALPHLPVFTLSAALAARVKNGHALPLSVLPAVEQHQGILLDERGTPLALVEKKETRDAEVWTIGRGLWNN